MMISCRRGRALLCTAGLAVMCLLLSGCQSAAGFDAGATPSTPSVTSTMKPRVAYMQLVDAVVAHGGRVWVEVDLVKAWLESPQRYADVLNVALGLASRPGVDGIKIADELGYHDGLDDPARVHDFLVTTSTQIHRRLPHTKVLVDMIVPQLGCAAWIDPSQDRDDCANQAGNRAPGSTIDAVDSYLAARAIDVLDLSVGLRDESVYQKWGTNRDAVMTAAWREVGRRQWSTLVKLQARKALAHPGTYAGSAAQAASDLHTFVDLPLAGGAAAVDVWTWSQDYQGEPYRLTDPDLAPNALTTALLARRTKGATLWTHMTPASMQVDVPTDLRAAMKIFSAVFVAAGAG